MPLRLPSRPRGGALVAVPTVVVLSAALLGLGASSALAKTVTVDVDGVVTQIQTHADTVGGVAADVGVEITDRVTVEPAPATPVSDGARVVIDQARLLKIVIDGDRNDRWTSRTTVAAALADAGFPVAGSWLSVAADAPVPLRGGSVEVRTPKPVTVVDGGTPRTVTSTAATVAALLAEQDVTVRERDRVGVALATPVTPGMTVAVSRVDERTDTVRVQVPAPVRTVSDANLTTGTTRVLDAGAPGVVERTVRITVVDGSETGRTVVSERVVTAARTKVVAKGTKPRPVAPKAPAPSSSGSGGSGGAAPGSTGSLNWAALARCESGGNPRAVSASGAYRGLYQFSLSTWRGVGGVGDPIDASPSEQTYRAQVLYSRSGASPWPHCGKYLFT